MQKFRGVQRLIEHYGSGFDGFPVVIFSRILDVPFLNPAEIGILDGAIPQP
jgi:hypothetical protein